MRLIHLNNFKGALTLALSHPMGEGTGSGRNSKFLRVYL
jgi:hypothetical protein